MSWIRRLFTRGPSATERQLAAQALRSLRKLIGKAKTVNEARRRIARGAEKGDLDDVVGLLMQSDAEVRDFIERG